ncbi:MAG: hypothetical protein GX418_07225 [Clostridiales bacterium]|nr:hypothetical protein [Clostridiales bacterium]
MSVEVISLKREIGRVEAILRSGARIRLRIRGTSMLPLLDEKTDAVLLTAPTRIRRGDVVLYRRAGGDVALHRIHAITASGCALLGDHQWIVETGIAAEQIIGVVERVEKKRFGFSVRHPLYRAYVRLIRRKFFRKALLKLVSIAASRKGSHERT